jgi:AcrR family transcriptional regulator
MARPRSDISERIHDAACERFLADGVDGASLRAIAAKAQTSIGMVYYYYPSKDELFFAVVEETYAKLVLDLGLALAPDVSVEERLRRLFERLGALSAAELRVLRLVATEVLKSTVRLERLVKRFQSGHVALIASTVRDAFAEGTFAPGRHPLVAMVSMAGLAGIAQIMCKFAGEHLPFPGAPAGKELSAELVDVLLRGVSTEPARRRP